MVARRSWPGFHRYRWCRQDRRASLARTGGDVCPYAVCGARTGMSAPHFLRVLMGASSSRNAAQLRLYLLGGMLLFWFFAISLRLVYLQIFEYGEFEQR